MPLLNADLQVGLAGLFPLAILVTAAGRTLTQWLFRHGAFGISARGTVLGSAVSGGGKLAFIPIHTSGLVLVAMNLAGVAVSGFASWLAWRQQDAERTSDQDSGVHVSMINVAKRYSDFPKWRLPQDLINAASHSLPLILLGGLFGADAAGYYSIAATVLAMPSTLIGQSVGSVFYPRITQAIQLGEDATKLIWRATRGLAWVGFWPYLMIVLAGPWLFDVVFGAGWARAGSYAQWLAPWLLLQLLNQPAVSAIPALGLQRELLIYEVFSTSSKVLALWIGFEVLDSDVAAVALFSAAGVIAYAVLIIWVILRSKAPRVRRIFHDGN